MILGSKTKQKIDKMDIKEIIDKNITNWLKGSYDQQTKDAIVDMQNNNTQLLEDSFYTNLAFGTGGLRGIMGVGTNRMNIYTVGMATQGLSNYLNEVYPSEPISVAISYDNRNNNTLFANCVADIFSANSIKVYMFDAMRPTPELSFAIRELGCKSGVMITASHNPKEYNGYKAYWSDGAQVVAPHDQNIIDHVNKITDAAQVKWEGNKSIIEYIGSEIDDKFIDHILALKLNKSAVDKYGDFKIVYTPIHGTGVEMMPKSLKAYGFPNVELVKEQAIADGDFPTVIHPNPEDPKALAMAMELAQEIGAELVLATDPDADRIAIAVRDFENNLIPINGNQTCALLSYYLLKAKSDIGQLKSNDYIIKTIVTTELVSRIAEKYNVECYNVLTGFKHIAAVIQQNEGTKNFVGGGEESYGYMIGERVRDKDSIASAAMICEIHSWAKSQNKTILDIIIEMYLEFGLFLESQVAITKTGMKGGEEIVQMMKQYRENPPSEINGQKVTQILDYKTQIATNLETGESHKIELPMSNVLQFVTSDHSIVSIRPSGTEPKIKFYFGVCEQLASKEKYAETLILAEKKIENIKKSLSL